MMGSPTTAMQRACTWALAANLLHVLHATVPQSPWPNQCLSSPHREHDVAEERDEAVAVHEWLLDMTRQHHGADEHTGAALMTMAQVDCSALPLGWRESQFHNRALLETAAGQ